MKTKGKIMGGVVVLLLAITFLPSQVAYSGERWDKLSMGAKSAVGSIIGAVSSDAGKYIKTTNFGVGQRIGVVIDRVDIGIAVANRNILSGLGIGPNMTLSPQAVGKNCTSVKLVGFVKGIPMTVRVPNTTSICNSSKHIPIGNNTSAEPMLIQKEILISNK